MNFKIISFELILLLSFCVENVRGHNQWGLPWIEYLHDPRQYFPPRVNNGSNLPPDTPDFRVEEDTWYAHVGYFYKEENRPYRISPHFKQIRRWKKSQSFWLFNKKEYPYLLGCYCTTVYKRLTVLAGAAAITTRHILTTASSTELVLKLPRKKELLDNILGAWYDVSGDSFNSSMYMTPARIHYHPRYLHPTQVNHTHPLPVSFDLSVWAATHKFMGFYLDVISSALICSRGGPHWWQYLSSTPRYWDMAHIVGFQFIKAFRKRPMPWFKYVIRSRYHTVPCPKTDWGWMHCMPGRMWGKYGVEQGASWHRAMEARYWLFDGLIGSCAFSMNLRSDEMNHYFLVLNTHPTLSFMYDAYMGLQPYRFLDERFWDTQHRSPYKKPWRWIDTSYPQGRQVYDDNWHDNVMPFY